MSDILRIHFSRIVIITGYVARHDDTDGISSLYKYSRTSMCDQLS